MKIITPVGTSLHSNWSKQISGLRDFSHENYTEELFSTDNPRGTASEIRKVRKALEEFISENPKNGCAEISSIHKIDKEENDEIYLICTETILSRICGEVLEKYLKERCKNLKIVKGLQVKDVQQFKQEGITNLLNEFDRIANGYWDDICFNITGGYKATIPVLTIISQVQQRPAYYLFEDSNELIEIPAMPIDYRSDVFTSFETEFSHFGDNSDELLNADSLSRKFLIDCQNCLEIADNVVALNPFGKILWRKYKQDYFSFYTTDTCWKEFENLPRLLAYFKQSFTVQQLRESHIVAEGSHKTVMKKNNDTLRIYWFVEKNKIYVYKIFEDHNKHEAYINSVNFDENFKLNQIQKSELKTIKIK